MINYQEFLESSSNNYLINIDRVRRLKNKSNKNNYYDLITQIHNSLDKAIKINCKFFNIRYFSLNKDNSTNINELIKIEQKSKKNIDDINDLFINNKKLQKYINKFNNKYPYLNINLKDIVPNIILNSLKINTEDFNTYINNQLVNEDIVKLFYVTDIRNMLLRLLDYLSDTYLKEVKINNLPSPFEFIDQYMIDSLINSIEYNNKSLNSLSKSIIKQQTEIIALFFEAVGISNINFYNSNYSQEIIFILYQSISAILEICDNKNSNYKNSLSITKDIENKIYNKYKLKSILSNIPIKIQLLAHSINNYQAKTEAKIKHNEKIFTNLFYLNWATELTIYVLNEVTKDHNLKFALPKINSKSMVRKINIFEPLNNIKVKISDSREYINLTNNFFSKIIKHISSSNIEQNINKLLRIHKKLTINIKNIDDLFIKTCDGYKTNYDYTNLFYHSICLASTVMNNTSRSKSINETTFILYLIFIENRTFSSYIKKSLIEFNKNDNRNIKWLKGMIYKVENILKEIRPSKTKLIKNFNFNKYYNFITDFNDNFNLYNKLSDNLIGNNFYHNNIIKSSINKFTERINFSHPDINHLYLIEIKNNNRTIYSNINCEKLNICQFNKIFYIYSTDYRNNINYKLKDHEEANTMYQFHHLLKNINK